MRTPTRQASAPVQPARAAPAPSSRTPRQDSLVIVPTYNEAGNLERLVPRVLATGPFDLLVVDDNSPDGTGQIADDLADRYRERVAVIHRPGKLGLGTAYVAGFSHALDRGYEQVSAYAACVLGLPFLDLTSGFKGLRRRAIEALDLDAIRSNGYAFQIEVTHRCYRAGLRIGQVPITFTSRRIGRSKLDRRVIAEALLVVWSLRRQAWLEREVPL
jgi:dolichol-phosphate mannosyltransferase